MTEGQGWVVIAVLFLILIMLIVLVVQIEDFQTLVRLMDVACPA